MWVWVLSGIAVIVLAILMIGCRRVSITRQVGPEEGIEDTEEVRAYDEISRWFEFKLLRKIIIGELKKYNPRGVLVDVGCGPGYLIADISREFRELSIVGLDISEGMLQKASKNISAQGLKDNVSFRQGDVSALPFESDSLDFVVSTLSLHHWSEPAQGIREIHRVLKPEGQFLIFDLRRDSPRLFYWIIRFAQMFILPAPMRRNNEPTSSVLANYTPVELEAILKATPFKHWNIKRGIFYLFACGRKDLS